MKSSNLLIATVVGSIVTIAATATPANANCTKSTWKKIAGDSFAQTIKGRDCGSTMSARFSGPAGNTGWLDMKHYLEDRLRADFYDGNITTKAVMKATGGFMTVTFDHQDATGLQSQTKGTYILTKYK